MAITKVSFTLVDDKQYKNGRFEIDNLEIVGKGEGLDIRYDDINLYLDGKLYDGHLVTWGGCRLSASDIFEQVLSAYLREDHSDYSEFKGFEIFEKFEALKEYKDNLLVKFPVYNFSVDMYKLELATPESRYYSCGDRFLLLDENNGIVTDMECWFETAIAEDICSVLKGERECLYKSENVDSMIEEYGGADGYLREYAGT